jgi:hypothetical protein
MFHHLKAFVAIPLVLAAVSFAQDSSQQDADKNKDKNFDVRSSVGDLHVGADADARKAGLPLYPGAQIKADDDNQNKANLSLFTEAFGFKLVVVNYESNDAPGKVLDFYRDKLKKYGKVLECHTQKHGGDADVHTGDKDSKESKELKCEGDNSGPVTELKVGTEDNQHVVAVEPADNGKRSTFAIVYVHTRGKEGDI